MKGKKSGHVFGYVSRDVGRYKIHKQHHEISKIKEEEKEKGMDTLLLRWVLTDLELLLAPIGGFDDDGDDLQERGRLGFGMEMMRINKREDSFISYIR